MTHFKTQTLVKIVISTAYYKDIIAESIPTEPEVLKYFYIRSEDQQFLYETPDENQVSVGREPVSCRWPSYYSIFHWRGHYLVNGRGHFLGLGHHSDCGPGFEYEENLKPKDAR